MKRPAQTRVAKPTKRVTAATSSKPNQPKKPATAAKPTRAAKPAKPAKPSKPAMAAKPSAPGKPNLPATGTLLHDIMAAWGIPPGLADAPIDKSWNGTASHMKVDAGVSQMLWGLSGAAVELLHAGAVLWAYARLRRDPSAAPLGHLAEAMFARQASPLYLRPVDEYRWFPSTDGASLAAGATAVLCHLVLKDTCEEPHQRALDSVTYPANLSISISRHVMPSGARAFGAWLENAVKVLRAVASLPGPVAPPAKSVSRKLQQELIAANTKAPYAPLALHTRLSVGITVSGVEYESPEATEQGRLAFAAPLSPFLLSSKPDSTDPGLGAVLARLVPTKNPFPLLRGGAPGAW